MDNTLSSLETEESRWVSNIQIISNLWTKLEACNWETFNYHQTVIAQVQSKKSIRNAMKDNQSDYLS